MKPTSKSTTNGIAEGKDHWEGTDEFRRKVSEVKRTLREKYRPILSAEQSWIKRLIIRICLWVETKKRIEEISSWKNLHFIDPTSLTLKKLGDGK